MDGGAAEHALALAERRAHGVEGDRSHYDEAHGRDRVLENPAPWPPSLLAFASSVAWGAGDFLGGLKSRQLPLLNVLVVLAGHRPGADRGVRRDPRGGAARAATCAVGAALRRRRRRSGWPPSTAASRSGTWAWSRRSRPPRPWSRWSWASPAETGRRRSSTRASRWRWSVSCSPRARRSGRGARRADRARRRAGAAVGARLRALLRRHGPRQRRGRRLGDPRQPLTRASTLLLAAFAVLRPPLAARRARTSGRWSLIGALDIAANAMFAVASTKGLVSLVSVLGIALPAHDGRPGRGGAGRAAAPPGAGGSGAGAVRGRADRRRARARPVYHQR